MRYLCFSDLHCDEEAARLLVTKSREADVLIGAGDFANQHTGLQITLSILSQIEKPAVLVPGNGETVEELTEAVSGWSSATVLHGNGATVSGQTFWGLGGAVPVTPFGSWSYDFTEDQAEAMLEGCPPDSVLVAHSPPLDTVDNDRMGRVRGSRAIRTAILNKKPKLCVCGHIHADWGKQVVLEETLVCNAGPQGQIIELK